MGLIVIWMKGTDRRFVGEAVYRYVEPELLEMVVCV